MIGYYIVYVTLILSILLAAITMVRLFTGKKAGMWGKATGVVTLIFVVAFVLWAKIELPNYEHQQDQINYQAGLNYLQAQNQAQALTSFKKITKYDLTTYNTVQPMIKDLQLQLAQSELVKAQALYSAGQHSEALQELKISLQYTELDESKALLPVYQAAASKK